MNDGLSIFPICVLALGLLAIVSIVLGIFGIRKKIKDAEKEDEENKQKAIGECSRVKAARETFRQKPEDHDYLLIHFLLEEKKFENMNSVAELIRDYNDCFLQMKMSDNWKSDLLEAINKSDFLLNSITEHFDKKEG